MSYSKSISREHRAYGSFGPNSKASALFDAAFSKPLPKKRFPTDSTGSAVPGDLGAVDSLPSVSDAVSTHVSPKQVLSSSSDEDSQASSSIIEPVGAANLINACITTASSTAVGLRSKSPQVCTVRTSTFEFDDKDDSPPPSMKRTKFSPQFLSGTKFMTANERRPVYQHKWTADDDEEPEVGNDDYARSTSVSTSPPQQPLNSNRGSETARINRVKEAHQCLESGEHDDFKQDIEYILSTMSSDTTITMKCLSTLSLARKCVSFEFRQFVRSEGLVANVFRGFADAANDQVWEVFTSYFRRMESVGKKIVFDITKDQLTPSSLILEALVFILARCSDETLKTEFLNLGILQWIVGKVEKIVLRMLHDKLTESDTVQQLIVLERCFRIIESCTLFHKKNQAFLISHRGSLLIQMCGKLMSIIHDAISNSIAGSQLARSHINCLSLMARVLMNLSHENELCCSKLGQVPGFLPLCLSSYTFLVPKFAPEDKKFDLYVMMTSLCVNLVERCNSNRRKLIDTSVKVYSPDGEETEHKALDALAILFTFHESKARNIDEDLDKDIAFEEPIDEDNDMDEECRDDGRLDRAKMNEMSESEMLQAVHSAMNKASAHMEDSVVASYVALLIGCLLQQNEGHASAVRSHLQGESFSLMIDQLQRFLDFMKIAPLSKEEIAKAAESYLAQDKTVMLGSKGYDNNPAFQILPNRTFIGSSAAEMCESGLGNCLRPFARIQPLIVTAPKYRLLSCMVQKTMSTVMSAILCFLIREKEFMEAGRSILREYPDIRLCGGRNEFHSMDKMRETYHLSNDDLNEWKFTVITREPVDRFLSGFIDRCIRVGDPCFGCGSNMTCFLEEEYNRALRYAFEDKYILEPKMTAEDLHVFPQNWRCKMNSYYKNYHFIRYSSDPSKTLLTDLIPLLKSQNVSESSIDYIATSLSSGRTAHSTVLSETRVFLEQRLRNSPYLMEIIVRLFYHDYKLLNYPLPNLGEVFGTPVLK
ncbi:hypothetical protein DICVIV_11508 [Dictyocaulus viviparus]|uniref:WAPL domain-containing protein n=1 Tax=Dictyocaulus viviparus TaxID=29172 RepID=A0A0D8XFK1_DICVI|nr:hypothetical protein DICVIV_11508 [Dictyocaulus viviparus]